MVGPDWLAGYRLGSRQTPSQDTRHPDPTLIGGSGMGPGNLARWLAGYLAMPTQQVPTWLSSLPSRLGSHMGNRLGRLWPG